MRGLFIIVLCVSAVYCAKLPVSPASRPVVKPVNDDDQHEQEPTVKPVENDDKNHHQQQVQEPVAIVTQDLELNPDGTYHNMWESENGIKVLEEGTIKVHKDTEFVMVAGEISYPGEDGKPIVLTYTADETGFHPHGDHLPTPPPVPEAIVRALEYIAAHPSINDEENVKTAPGQFDKTATVEDA